MSAYLHATMATFVEYKQLGQRGEAALGGIAAILPPEVATAELLGEDLDVSLFPEEEVALGRAGAKRRRQFTAGRACARRAMRCLGMVPVPILSGSSRQPIWPEGVVGSLVALSFQTMG